MKIFELIIACLLSTTALCCDFIDAPDILITKGTNGTAAVHTVISITGSVNISNAFNDSDHRFFRRLAFVTSKDGTEYDNEDDMLDGGGIWGIDQTKLDEMRKYEKQLSDFDESIACHIGVDILDKKFTLEDVVKPLYGFAAAHLYLSYVILVKGVQSVPQTDDIAGQADLWVKHFCVPSAITTCCREYFTDLVTELENQEGIGIYTMQ